MPPGVLDTLHQYSNSTLPPVLQLLSPRGSTTPNDFRKHNLIYVWLTLTTNVETATIIAACLMIFAVLIAWNVPVIRDIISGLKVCLP